MSFVSDEIRSRLGSLTIEDTDEFNFGSIKLDKDGTIIIYNKFESDMAGLERENAIGKNFFTEIAPCTNNKLFLSKFERAQAEGELDESFNFTFTYKMSPTSVGINMVKNSDDNGTWIFIEIQK